MKGRFQFTDLRDSVTNRRLCPPASTVVVCLSTVGTVSPMKGLEFYLPWRGWNSPSYRGSPGRPGPLLHLWFSCGTIMAITSGWHRAAWLTTTRAWYESHREYVEWSVRGNAGNLACHPSQKQRWAMGPCVRHVGWICFLYVLHSITNWVHDTTNEISGRNRRVLDYLLKKSISENSPFKG